MCVSVQISVLINVTAIYIVSVTLLFESFGSRKLDGGAQLANEATSSISNPFHLTPPGVTIIQVEGHKVTFKMGFFG